jgi:HAD superfamily hydrolase (TIGR01509 family)
MGGDKLFPRITGLSEDTPLGKEVSKARGAIFRSKYLPEIKAFSGSRELVERLREASMVVVIATSADKQDLTALLEIADVEDLIEDHVSASDAERSKPDPDIVKAALKRLAVPKEQVLMIGDTPYDIEAAALAGIRTIAFRSGGVWTDDDLVGALEIYDGPSELAQSL